ncbi:MAG: PDZ domain-containing protein, partial [Verrucomicrobia bacterium]|nr:PDZ domain-containing protein [Deltaproteobacteria bacterium]
KQAKGALVNNILKGGPAEKAGVRQGDVIIALNGSAVKDPSHLQRLVAEAGIGKAVKVNVFRDGKDVELSMTLSSAEAAPKQRRDSDGDDEGQSGQTDLLGLVVADAEQGGVVVVDVARGGTAAEAGIRRGDVIVSINRKKISSSGEYQRIIQQAGHGSNMMILVRRANASIYFALRIK